MNFLKAVAQPCRIQTAVRGLTRPAFPRRSELSLILVKFNQFKAILGKFSLFQKIKDCLFLAAPTRPP
jgi:hypothetical protein